LPKSENDARVFYPLHRHPSQEEGWAAETPPL
jgi:hypothetical protein